MNLLLDTHIWLWCQLDPPRLGRNAARALADPANELWLSAISVWETCRLAEKGRLRLEGGVEVWVAASLADWPLRAAPVTVEIALASRTFAGWHYDPADRLLAATARVLDLTLVTADARLLRTPGIRTLSLS